MIRSILIIICSMLIFIFLYLIFLRIKKYIKPIIKETYIDYSPYNPILKDSAELINENELHYVYRILLDSIKDILITNNIIELYKDGPPKEYIYKVIKVKVGESLPIQTLSFLEEKDGDDLIKRDKLVREEELIRDEEDKYLYSDILIEIDTDIIKIDKKHNINITDTLLKNIIKYIFTDLSTFLKFIETNGVKTTDENKKQQENLILNLISVGYIERKVEEIRTYYRSKDDYINSKIREYVKLMDNFGIFDIKYNLAKGDKNIFFSKNEFKMNYIKSGLYNSDLSQHGSNEYIWNEYFQTNMQLMKIDLSEIKKINDTDQHHKIEENYEKSIPIFNLKNILEKNKTDNTQKYKLSDDITNDDITNAKYNILEEESNDDIRYALKNETLIKDIINNEIMKNINNNLQWGEIEFLKKNKINKNEYIYRTENDSKNTRDIYKMFEKEYKEDYKYLNHSIINWRKNPHTYILKYNTDNKGYKYTIEKNVSETCVKYSNDDNTMNLCSPYYVEIELDIYREYTNNVYKIRLDLVIFDDYKIPYEIEEEFTSDQKIYNYRNSIFDNSSKTDNENIINDLIRNKVFLFKDFEIIKTYYHELYINNYDLDDTRLKYNDYPVKDDNIKYSNDSELINKLVCKKKSKNNKLLHNYTLIDDKFTHFENEY